MLGLLQLVFLGSRRRARKVQEFTRQFAALLKSGLSEPEALRAIVFEMPPGPFGRVLAEVLWRVEQGTLLSYALQGHLGYFDPSYVSMVAAGERSGSLPESIGHLAELERRPAVDADKLLIAIILPAGLIAYLTFITFFMALFIRPKFVGLFGDFLVEPASATLLISSLTQWVWREPRILPLAAIVVVVLIIIVFDLAYYRPARKSLVLARFATALRVMLNVNVPIEEVEHAMAGLSPSRAYRRATRELFTKLKAGQSLPEAFRAVRYFPDTFQWLVASGEFQNDLVHPLGDLAHVYAVRADAKLSRIVNVMPSLITIWLGVVVGFFGYAFFTALIQILRTAM
ncbi:MAG: type II secretion system F family protein [Verrucomicrobia bacterium]|nr:type II secretion system F family protein [Verrucomicrobiota bacterium]